MSINSIPTFEISYLQHGSKHNHRFPYFEKLLPKICEIAAQGLRKNEYSPPIISQNAIIITQHHFQHTTISHARFTRGYRYFTSPFANKIPEPKQRGIGNYDTQGTNCTEKSSRHKTICRPQIPLEQANRSHACDKSLVKQAEEKEPVAKQKKN